MIFVGAIGPRHTDAQSYGRTMYARMQPATRDSVIALVQALMSGMNPDPVAACRAYEELLRRAALMQGDSTAPKGSSCRAPPKAVEYAHRYTSQVTFASLGQWDYTGALRRVSAPLLVIYGDRDPSPVSSQWAWAAAVPNGRLLVIPGAGHGPHVDRPNVFFPAVDAFLSGSWPQAAVSRPGQE
jgi:pimeloyl-ACP methyl ester carboxylesterase